MGGAAALAAAVKKVYGKVAEIRAAHPEPQGDFGGSHIGSPNHISGGPLERILGITDRLRTASSKVVIGRTTAMQSTSVGNEMGVYTWAAFTGTNGKAVVDGDFAMTESELQTVLKAMRHQGINVVAIHQHMSMEQPRILFLPYWGLGKAEGLAQP